MHWLLLEALLVDRLLLVGWSRHVLAGHWLRLSLHSLWSVVLLSDTVAHGSTSLAVAVDTDGEEHKRDDEEDPVGDVRAEVHKDAIGTYHSITERAIAVYRIGPKVSLVERLPRRL